MERPPPEVATDELGARGAARSHLPEVTRQVTDPLELVVSTGVGDDEVVPVLGEDVDPLGVVVAEPEAVGVETVRLPGEPLRVLQGGPEVRERIQSRVSSDSE